MILETFGPQAAAKNVKIKLEIQDSLRMPDEMYHLEVEGFPLKDKNQYSSYLSTEQQTNTIPKLIGDPRRFKQVLMNLVKNALKFTLKGSVLIRACYMKDQINQQEGMIVVHVVDTGSGISQEDFPKLFTRFGKLQRTADINSEGIGLGLTMVKQIVETAGGIVGVESDGVGLGSLFSFCMKMDHVTDDFNEQDEENIKGQAIDDDPLRLM